MRTLAMVLALLLASACASGGAPSQESRVFVIVMENQTPAEALSGAFTSELATRIGVAANYHAVTHPSVPNYLALTSGQTWGVQDDSYHALPSEDIGHQLTAQGIPWRAYMEGLTDAGCLNSPAPYDPGHNPFAFYGGACPLNVVPLTALPSDLAAASMRFSFIVPDACHDQHSCPVDVGDAWLRDTVGLIQNSSAWRPGAVLLITWDEDDGSGDNSVLTLVDRAGGGHVVSHHPYTHYSLLATVEDLLGLPRLSQARYTTSMNDLAVA